MNDIADISDLSRRTLYIYFHNKEEILLTIAVNSLKKILSEMEIDKSPNNKKALDKLLYFGNIYSKLFYQDDKTYQFLPNFTNCVRSVGKDNEIVQECELVLNKIMDRVTYLLVEGIEDKSIRPLPNPKHTAALLLGMVHSLIQSVGSDYDLISVGFHIKPEEFLNEAFGSIYHYLSIDYVSK